MERFVLAMDQIAFGHGAFLFLHGAFSLRSWRGSETPILGRSNPHAGENANPSREEPLSVQGGGAVAMERNPLEKRAFHGDTSLSILITFPYSFVFSFVCALSGSFVKPHGHPTTGNENAAELRPDGKNEKPPARCRVPQSDHAQDWRH